MYSIPDKDIILHSSTTTALYHPDVIDLPILAEFHTNAMLPSLAIISTSRDPLLKKNTSRIFLIMLFLEPSVVQYIATRENTSSAKEQ